MIGKDEDALLCDMAEHYKIYSLDSLPFSSICTLANGLPVDSRIKRKMDGDRPTELIQMLALIYDIIVKANWVGDGEPDSLYSILLNKKKEMSHGNKRVFENPEDFEREWEGN